MPNSVALPMTEADLQRLVTDAATALGWHWVHFRPARTAHGWATPVSGPLGQGWPDLFLCRPGDGRDGQDGRLLALEIKSAKGSPDVDQLAVHAVLIAAGLDVRIVRPSDIDDVLDLLR